MADLLTQRIGMRIEELREEKGLTQKELAFKAGLTERTINRWTNGTVRARWENLEALAEALDVNVVEIVDPGKGTSRKTMQQRLFEVMQDIEDLRSEVAALRKLVNG